METEKILTNAIDAIDIVMGSELSDLDKNLLISKIEWLTAQADWDVYLELVRRTRVPEEQSIEDQETDFHLS